MASKAGALPAASQAGGSLATSKAEGLAPIAAASRVESLVESRVESLVESRAENQMAIAAGSQSPKSSRHPGLCPFVLSLSKCNGLPCSGVHQAADPKLFKSGYEASCQADSSLRGNDDFSNKKGAPNGAPFHFGIVTNVT